VASVMGEATSNFSDGFTNVCASCRPQL